MEKIKAVQMFSGGLDSIVSARIIIEQNIDLRGIYFVSPFFNIKKIKRDLQNVMKAAAQINLPLEFIPLGKEYLDMLRSPRYGRGAGFNPCIDCRIYLFGIAHEYMKKIGAEFIVTGEVIGQRPMSQTRGALNLIDKRTPFHDRILKPLSAKLLQPTYPELQGYIDREKLFDITGRSRHRQIGIARGYELEYVPDSGGGCLITEGHYSKRVYDLYKYNSDVTTMDVILLRFGRQFRLPGGAKMIAARDQQEALWLEIYAERKNLLYFYPQNHKGPFCIFTKVPDKDDLGIGMEIAANYCKGNDDGSVSYIFKDGRTETIEEYNDIRNKYIIG